LASGDLKMSPTQNRLNGSPFGAKQMGKALFLAGLAAGHGLRTCCHPCLWASRSAVGFWERDEVGSGRSIWWL